MRYHSNYGTVAKWLLRWLECYSAFHFLDYFRLHWSRSFH